MSTVWADSDGAWRTTLRRREVLADPRINKGTAFSDAERAALGITGLIPAGHMTLGEQVSRVSAQYQRQTTDLARNVLLTELHDRNEVLFYRLLISHLSEMLPIIYTPTVGQAIENYSHEYRRPRGIYLSVDRPELIEASLRAAGLGSGEVDLIVATDAGAILGIGDWGVGGIHIAVGKLAVYTAAGGIDPNRVLPVMLDVGTDRQSLLDDPLYIGNRHPRVTAGAYDDFLDAFVAAVRRLFPGALLHWEDIGVSNARRVLERYRGTMLTFNDDIQGTGAGGLTTAQALDRIWALDRTGLLITGDPALSPQQRRYARDPAAVAAWPHDAGLGGIALAEVIRQVRPTILIGTSARGGSFSEAVVTEMAAHVSRPVIMPMSNPTSLAEARPADLIRWTRGRALVAAGSPFGPVDYGGTRYLVGQANNALVFPGLGLGAIAAGASRVTDGMLSAAAHAVAGLVDTVTPGAPLLPQVETLRDTSLAVATAVAQAAAADGVAARRLTGDVSAQVSALMWQPDYRPVRPA